MERIERDEVARIQRRMRKLYHEAQRPTVEVVGVSTNRPALVEVMTVDERSERLAAYDRFNRRLDRVFLVLLNVCAVISLVALIASR